MKLVCQTKLHFREGASDKIYEVDLCETGDRYVVNFRYGRRGSELKEGTKTSAPVEFEAAAKIFEKLVDEKKRKGYHIVGEIGRQTEPPAEKAARRFDEDARERFILEALGDARAKSNPRIERLVWRAGELKLRRAAPLLTDFIGTAKELRDYCIAWSLGFCGDAASVPALENLARHRAEHVRRIAREALRKIGDENLRRRLTEETLAELPERLRAEISSGTVESVEAALREEIGRSARTSLTALSRLYEIDNHLTRPVLLKLLREIPLKARYFKPVRQIFKAAEYRRDAQVFGAIAKRFEIEKAAYHSSSYSDWLYVCDEKGRWQRVRRSAELAKEDSLIAYGDRTREYFRRRAWRTLRRLGEIGDADYVPMSAAALLEYTDADAAEPKKTELYDYYHTGRYDWRDPKVTEVSWDRFAPYLLFNHLLYGQSPRYELKAGSRAFRLKAGRRPDETAPAVREESFPRLWEAQPQFLLRLLKYSKCRPVHEFAAKALGDCPEFISTIEAATVLELLAKPYEATNRFAFRLARELYDAARPNVELGVAVALSNDREARREAFRWIEAKHELYAKNEAAMLRLLTCSHADTRRFAAALLRATDYSEAEAKSLIALLVVEFWSFGDERREIAAELGDAVLQSFAREIRSINLSVVEDLLAHPLVEAQIFGARLLLDHETRAEDLPSSLIDALIGSPFENVRAIGVVLFDRLPDENLLRRDRLIVSLLAHESADLHHAIRATAVRLAARYPNFRANLANAIFLALLRGEKAEGVHARLAEALRETNGWEQAADFETARLLIDSQHAAAADVGGSLLESRLAEWTERMTTADLIELSSHETLAVRRAAWRAAERKAAGLRSEAAVLIRALDAAWSDSREFWRGFFRTAMTAAELTPAVLVAICDSVRAETQKFGRDLLLHYFAEENGAEYLVKLSEHPSAAMQLFATNYMERHAAGAPERLARLEPYFVRVLSQVNRARTAKNRVLRFLETEASKDERAARVAARILARQSATIAVGDKASMIEAMLKIRRRYPEIELPLTIKPTEVRNDVV